MVIAISSIKVRDGHFDKVLTLLEENASTARSQTGCLECYVARGIDDPDELLLYTLWQKPDDYKNARKLAKKDSNYAKMIFQLLSHIAKQPKIQSFEVLPVN